MVDERGEPKGSMGPTVGDYNNIRLDGFLTNLVEQSNTL